jgi:hypothetical protein
MPPGSVSAGVLTARRGAAIPLDNDGDSGQSPASLHPESLTMPWAEGRPVIVYGHLVNHPEVIR